MVIIKIKKVFTILRYESVFPGFLMKEYQLWEYENKILFKEKNEVEYEFD